MAADLLWTLVFAAWLLLAVLLRAWLLWRQMRHVARHAHRVPAPFAGWVDPAQHQRAARYTLDKAQLTLLEMLFGSAVLVAWTLLGGLDALNRLLLAWLGEGLAQQVALVAAFLAIGATLELPWAWWRTFRLEQRHGFNRTTLALWVADGLKGALVAAVLGLPLLAAVLWLMEHGGGLWWLWVWGVWMGFQVLLLLIFPRVIAPLFNRFEPLRDEALLARVQALLQRCGFRAEGVFVVDGSRRSAHANAYFTGIGPTKRVVLFDTLLQHLTPEQIEAVLAHELGHARLRHIPRRLALLAATSAAGLALLAWLAQQPWFYHGLGVTPQLAGGNAALALILFLLLAPLAGVWLTPLLNALSRRDEFAADTFASQHASAAALAQALLALHRDNASTLTPDPLYVRFHYSHPPAAQRLARLGLAGDPT
ncbi:M48 family metallopeptidase [Tepidimonas sp.]|uniref:M48 family metallopeptidase n=1 Tax=Tepidimonas sp. TaxID=2002775 RepID=UPI002FDF4C8B